MQQQHLLGFQHTQRLLCLRPAALAEETMALIEYSCALFDLPCPSFGFLCVLLSST
eukprot:m.5812 g.5812  ORF g.5812 m.5812 type:complete len:56 (-) comp2547_c0_seq1:153-320(-)